MTKQTHVNVGDTWKPVKSVWQNVNGVWKKDVMPKINVGGVYKECMSYAGSPQGVLGWVFTGHTSIVYNVAISKDEAHVFSFGNDRYVRQILAETGSAGWSTYMSSVSNSNLVVSSDDGYIYLSTSSYLYKLDPSNGNIIWSVARNVQSTHIANDNTLYNGSYEYLYEIDKNDGSVIKTYTYGRPNSETIVTNSDNTIVYRGDLYGELREYNLVTEAEGWVLLDNSTDSDINEIGISRDDAYIYLVRENGNVEKVNAATGDYEWAFDHSSGRTRSLSVAKDGPEYIYIGDQYGYVRQIYGQNGSEGWVVRPNPDYIYSLAVTSNGKIVYSADRDSEVNQII